MADVFGFHNKKGREDEQSIQSNESIQNEKTEDEEVKQHEKYESKIENSENREYSALMEHTVYHDDYLEHETNYEYVEEAIKSVSSDIIDWEKEAKETIHLETNENTLKERRKTIFDLDSFSASGVSSSDLLRLTSKDYVPEPPTEIRYSVSLGVPGTARINLSPLTQKVIGCVIGENVSTEYPWVYVRKEIIEDNIDLHEDSSDFLPVKNEIRKFPNSKILIGYVPSLTEEGQFYICLTEEGRDAVVEEIQKQREEHENRVRTAVYKPLGRWQEFSSSVEIEATIVKNTRPLLEIEVLGTADVLDAPLRLKDRKVEDVSDGYIQLLPYRQLFENIPRKLLSNMTQVTPDIRNMKTQTALSVPANCWIQYKYEYQSPDISNFTPDQTESLKSFLRRFTDYVCDQLLLNATWDIYTNDYGNLVRNIRDTQWPIPVSYEEHLSFQDEQHVVNKVINDLCWHPLWTGIAFAAYTSYAKSQHLIGPKSNEEVVKAYDNNFVLVWSFNDCLAPKLVLESPREVTSVAVNPLDGNLVVGGCANGQIVLWHIPGKIEKVEAVVVYTAAQIKHRMTIKTLIAWMQEVLDTSIIRPTAISSLKESQKAAVIQIIWISPYDQLDSSGRITSLPEDTSTDDLSLQFVTASEDGTIAFWNLKLNEKWQMYKKKEPSPRKKGKVKRPEALIKSVSPFKILDRVFKPCYILVAQHPNESRNVVITTISMYVPKFEKKRVDVGPPSQDVTVRRYFENIIKKPDYVMQPKIHVGTVEGDFGCVTWEGYDFTTDLAINTEKCRWCWFKRVHDGPITHTVRSRENRTWLVTIGGKIFAIWEEDLGIPLFWKKSDIGYTAVSWGSFRPTILILTRLDGTVELWDFMVKTDEPCVLQSLSGRIITGIYTHELHLTPQCVGFCDFNGILRMFLAPTTFFETDSACIEWMTNFIQRQVKRVKNCREWLEKWLETNYKEIEQKERLSKEAEKRKQQEEEKATVSKTVEVESLVEPVKKSLKRWEMIQESRRKWEARELKHMQQVLLEKKGLRKDDLEKQREPILKLGQEKKRKKQKLRQTLKMQENIFEHTKSLFFPKHQPETRLISVPPMTEKFDEPITVEDTILEEEMMEIQRIDPNEEIIYHFMEIQAKVLANLQKHPFEYSFNWKNILKDKKTLRVTMDAELRKLNKFKRKVI
ncbi:dynein axonemal intermediate chain 3-like isoform X2 [Frieseomelitta varia]|uniref:dynein axonemal intermediate chain 3-like isoform X2 n=1 Tax=Frieseomelitta varia TaxID=561572 RepID=UPI001CB6ACCC|nr:dynein axonemal intermediate chain 3-like isoform X2 [Frieseomelitta varia]